MITFLNSQILIINCRIKGKEMDAKYVQELSERKEKTKPVLGCSS